jgi:hypothetical protein
MVNKRGMELAISTVVVIIISVLVLIGLAYAVSYGFSYFKESVDDSSSGAELTEIKASCNLHCINENGGDYCCEVFEYEGGELGCEDALVGLDCEINCGDFECE